MQSAKKDKKKTARITPGKAHGPPGIPYRGTHKSPIPVCGSDDGMDEEELRIVISQRDATIVEQNKVIRALQDQIQHLRNVEQANRGLQKTKVNYASYTADLKADLAATKVMNRELLKRARDLQASIRKVEAAVRECLQDGE
ncbi:hypothetical protein EV715DRAFT_214718 [Schizophyllum commune]